MSRLVKDYDIAFVSTGDVLRKEIMAKSEVGKRAEEVVASGGGSSHYLTIVKEADRSGLVPDELMLDVVKAELDRLKGKVSFVCRAIADSQSWIIDGFPRTLHQGELLDQVLEAEVAYVKCLEDYS
jgi:adenylate kinase family enzyme